MPTVLHVKRPSSQIVQSQMEKKLLKVFYVKNVQDLKFQKNFKYLYFRHKWVKCYYHMLLKLI